MPFIKDLAITALVLTMLAVTWIAIPIIASVGILLCIGLFIYTLILWYREFQTEKQEDRDTWD